MATITARYGKAAAAGPTIFRAVVPFVYLSPALMLFLVFFLIPSAFSFVLSTLDWNLVSPYPRFVGFQNFVRSFNDPTYWQSIWSTLLFTLGVVPTSVTLGFCIATLVESSPSGRTFYRSVLFLPVVLSISVAAFAWESMLNPQVGLIHQLMQSIGIAEPNWLQDASWALPMMVVISIWKGFGYNVVLFSAGLQTIDTEIYEAATLDGASWFGRFWLITIPMLSSFILFVSIIAVISSFQAFTLVQIMTNGGPQNSTNLLAFRIWQQAFTFADIGLAMATAVTLFLLILGLTSVQFRLGESRVYYR